MTIQRLAIYINNMKLTFKLFISKPEYIIALPFLIIIRFIRPLILIRFGALISSRIGHLAANTELYLCELNEGINRPSNLFIDIFYLDNKPVCNKYLVKMWKRELNILPSFIIKPLANLNQILTGGQIHKIINTQDDRDVNNLLDKYPNFIKFTNNEEIKGEDELKIFGLSKNDKFVCLLVRDSAYLPNLEYHNYRDCSINNYLLACEELTKRGYYVFRMGVKVHNKVSSSNPKIIDYASNGMRSEFMDIYLGAKCEFCISTSSGWDAIPLIFRKPIVYAPVVPIGYMFTFSRNFLAITKHHFDKNNNKELTLCEIFAKGLGFSMSSQDYESNNILLIENSPEEILDLVIEFDDRSKNIWEESEEDILLQNKFWNIFPSNSIDIEKKNRLHGEIRARYGSSFLRKNPNFLKL